MINEQDQKPPEFPLINYRVDEFFSAHRIGKTKFYDEVKQGRLNVMKVGDRTLVPVLSAEA